MSRASIDTTVRDRVRHQRCSSHTEIEGSISGFAVNNVLGLQDLVLRTQYRVKCRGKDRTKENKSKSKTINGPRK